MQRIRLTSVNGFPCYELKPRTDLRRKQIIFVHGGGYVEEMTSLHWEFVGKLLNRTHYSVTVPIYPLAPMYNYKQLLKERNLPQPEKLILLSPALDMSFSNPEVQEVEKIDPLLATPGIKDAAKWYSNDVDPKHYLISPLYGDFEGLRKISIFTGTHDLCNPDARKFKKMAEQKGTELDFYEYPGMPHVWTLFGLPESKKAMEQIISAIEK